MNTSSSNDADGAEKAVAVGSLTKPHGLKGEIRVHYHADSLELLHGEVYLQAGNSAPRAVRVRSCRLHQGAPVVLFEGINDRTAAEGLRGQTLLVPQTALPLPDEDEVYLNDLLGLDVFVYEQEGQETYLGVLDHVIFQGEQETWVIMTDDGKEVLLPAVPEFVADIDLDTERILVTPPPGLLELYLNG